MNIKVYEKLPKEAVMIRTEVFIKEQGFNNEFDEIDGNAKHIVIYELNNPVATCRVFYSENRQCYVIGRIAVLKEFRGNGTGRNLLNVAEKEIIKNGGDAAELLAQVRVSRFYEKNGYHSMAEYHNDEGCMHVVMRKELISTSL